MNSGDLDEACQRIIECWVRRCSSVSVTYGETLVEQRLDFGFAKVGHADRCRLALLEELLHRRPGVDKGSFSVDHLAIRIYGETLRPAREGARIMHHEEIHVRRVQVLQRIVESLFHIVRMVVVAPQLGT